MEIIIEEINRGHKTLSRHKFNCQSINIGRGYDNDMILSDPHICANHVQLQFDGEHWLLSDNNSVNGSYLEGSKDNIKQHQVQSGDVINLGKSQIRLLLPHHPVEKSLAISPFEDLINLARHPLALAISISLFAFIAGWVVNLNNTNDVTLTQRLVPALSLTLGFTLWPAGVAFVSYLTKHEPRFWAQIGIAFIFFNLMWLSDVLESIVHFNTSSQFSLLWLIAIIPLVLSFGLFWLNCYVGFHMTPRRRNLVALTITALLFGGGFIVQLSKTPEFDPRPNFDTTLMSPSFLFTSSSSVEQFVADSDKLFKQASKLTKKEN